MRKKRSEPADSRGPQAERDLKGQQLCEPPAIRLEQYGLMAKSVGKLGVHNTGDIGDLVFNLIDIGQMRKTKEDTRKISKTFSISMQPSCANSK